MWQCKATHMRVVGSASKAAVRVIRIPDRVDCSDAGLCLGVTRPRITHSESTALLGQAVAACHWLCTSTRGALPAGHNETVPSLSPSHADCLLSCLSS